MLTRKKLTENDEPQQCRREVSKKGVTVIPTKGDQVKEDKVSKNGQRRFGDITNATKQQNIENKKKGLIPIKVNGKNVPSKNNKPVLKKTETKLEPDSLLILSDCSSISSSTSSISSLSDPGSSKCPDLTSADHVVSSTTTLPVESVDDCSSVPVERVEEDFSFVVTENDDDPEIVFSSRKMETRLESLPSVDLENPKDIFNVGIYAQHIFDYYKRREKMFRIPNYMGGKQCPITPVMRAILVDWMVEVQENFELNHETLYLAVKLVDTYLSRVSADKEILQLIGAAAVFVAAKFDERSPPLVEDFLYICDNGFKFNQFIAMEIELLKTLDFNLGIPLSYSFLRRYARVARMSIQTLTLARYILELSLMEYSLVEERESLLAAGALYIAQKMKGEGAWEGEVVTSSGYTVQDIKDVVIALNKMLHARPVSQLSTIRSKYSHEIFHKVAKIKPLPTDQLFVVVAR